jgi:hypothetical protein
MVNLRPVMYGPLIAWLSKTGQICPVLEWQKQDGRKSNLKA